MDRITAMTTFVRVVEAGSFTKAAETLDVPKATVTRLIQALEEELRIRLLHRTTRSVTVTAEGASYYERVVRLLADLHDIESSARQSLSKPSGRIHVDVPNAIATMVLLPALKSFYEAYPDVQVELGSGNRNVDLVAENIDCAIRVGKITQEFLVARRIGEFNFITCAAPSYLAQRGTPHEPEDLRQHDTVGMISIQSGRMLSFRFARDGTTTEILSEPRLLVNDTNAYLAAAMAGLGIVQTAAYTVQSALASGQLQAVLQEWQTPCIPIHVVYAPNRFLSAKVRVFIDWVVELFEASKELRVRP